MRDEGGVDCRILEDLGPIEFFYRMGQKGFVKTVDFYLMAYEGGDPANHDHEVQEARWFPLAEVDRLAFPTERGVVSRAREIVEREASFSLRGEASPGPPEAP